MKKGIVKNIEIPLYRIIVNILIAKDCKKAIKLSDNLKGLYKDWNFKGMYGCYIHSEKKNVHAIILSEDADIDTVVHECFHATMSVVENKGIKYSEDSEECFAYVMGYLTKEVWEIKNNIK